MVAPLAIPNECDDAEGAENVLGAFVLETNEAVLELITDVVSGTVVSVEEGLIFERSEFIELAPNAVAVETDTVAVVVVVVIGCFGGIKFSAFPIRLMGLLERMRHSLTKKNFPDSFSSLGLSTNLSTCTILNFEMLMPFLKPTSWKLYCPSPN